MSMNRKMLLCRYRYDPLDRLVDCTPAAQASLQRFYLKDRLSTEIQGSTQRSIYQQADQPLAQLQRRNGAVEITLFTTDLQRSVMHALDATGPHPLAYAPYGHRAAENGLLSMLGFNGERPDPVTGHYLLGNGYRAFNPVLMRFHSPDSWSPFGEGGLNAYSAFDNDPTNKVDPSGHIPVRYLYNLIQQSKSAISIIRPQIINNTKQIGTLLKNKKPHLLPLEKDLFKWAQKNNSVFIKNIEKPTDLSFMSESPSMAYKFILTKDKFIVGGIDKSRVQKKFLSHPVLADYAGVSDVISAGFIEEQNNVINIKNKSGHYRPIADDLLPAQTFLGNLGINANLIRLQK